MAISEVKNHVLLVIRAWVMITSKWDIYIQTYKHTSIQAYKHTHIETHVHSDISMYTARYPLKRENKTTYECWKNGAMAVIVVLVHFHNFH